MDFSVAVGVLPCTQSMLLSSIFVNLFLISLRLHAAGTRASEPREELHGPRLPPALLPARQREGQEGERGSPGWLELAKVSSRVYQGGEGREQPFGARREAWLTQPNPGRFARAFLADKRALSKSRCCLQPPVFSLLPALSPPPQVLKLLLVAWDRRLIFAIGTSSTTGESDTVIWNEIHHKTEFGSNLTGHGYPDINYLDNVLAELAAQGITEESLAQEKD